MRVPFRRKQQSEKPPPESPGTPAEGQSTPAPSDEPAKAPSTPASDSKDPAPGETPTTVDGLRAWVAQLDRKLGTRFYALAAAAVLALAAGIVAIVLVLGVKDDSATKDDLGQLREEVAGVEQSATQAVEGDVSALGDRMDELESQIQGLRSDRGSTDQEISVLQDDIADLRDDISTLRSDINDVADSASDSDPP